jgi:hypothetical protein
MIYRCRNCSTVLKAETCVNSQFCCESCSVQYYEYLLENKPVNDVFGNKIIVDQTVLYFSDSSACSANFAIVAEVHDEKGIEPHIILEYMGKCSGPDSSFDYYKRNKGQRSRKITAYSTKIMILNDLFKMVKLDQTVGCPEDPIDNRKDILDL